MAADPIAKAFQFLLDIMTRLRDPAGGCPWDLEQDFQSIAPYTIEEAYEVRDAVVTNDLAALREELGDLLFQVIFHSQMASEIGQFTILEVIDGINDKMIARHPHVFGDAQIANAEVQTIAWEAQKAKERDAKAGVKGAPAGILDGLPTALPALSRAYKLQSRASRTGFDWPARAPVLDKIREEIDELEEALAAHETARKNDIASGDRAAIEEEFGDVLFSLVNLSRHLNTDPEEALRKANDKFEKRFRIVEALAAEQSKRVEDYDLVQLEDLWRKAKKKSG